MKDPTWIPVQLEWGIVHWEDEEQFVKVYTPLSLSMFKFCEWIDKENCNYTKNTIKK